MNQPNAYVQNFKTALIADGKLPKTVKSYVLDVSMFLQWLEEKTGHDFDGTLTRFYITTYKAKLMEENYEVNTINKKINSLSSFNQFLVDEGIMQQMVVHGKKDKIKVASGSEKEVDVFTKEETERLLFFLEDKKVSKRNKLIVFLLLYTGVRVNELVNIQLKDMDLLTRQLKVYGKGGKYREVPLKNELIELIQDYLSTERKESRYSDSPFLFVSQRSPRMIADALNKLLNTIAAAVGMEIYPHKFRHTFCSNLLEKGVDITTVSQLAGHSSIETTHKFYIHTSKETKRNAVDLL